ncbi:MAG: DUF4867 family protein [Solobacterium sp.]|nr:DUF4867 family protein [Solobacterium sp.]
MLKRLNEVNDIEIRDVHDPAFAPYGRILEGYDFTELCEYMKKETQIPENGNIYVASVEAMESCAVRKQIEDVCYGGMPVQIGYCNGRNTTYNGFEYHKGSELNYAVTDFMLVLAHTWQIRNNEIHVKDANVFYVPEGTLIEMYQTTLHLSPCRVSDAGFRDIVILPKGTNTPLSGEEKADRDRCSDPEARLLLQRNKWVLSHPERKPLMDQGAHPGLIGENKELKY